MYNSIIIILYYQDTYKTLYRFNYDFLFEQVCEKLMYK